LVFSEVRGKSETEEVVKTENNPDTMRFELRNEEDDLDESIESKEEVEQLNLVVNRSKRLRKPVERYIPPDLCSTFMLTTIDDEPKSIGEEVDSTEGKIWKDSMV
jgi:hypothetical protein